VVPFWISGIRRRGIPPLPGLSRFPELNVRTYVTYGGKAGVYFFSLDAANLPAVWAARIFYHLPYFSASIEAAAENGRILYRSRRQGREAEFHGSYWPVAPAQPAEKGSLADWLTARFCLYTTYRNRVYRGEIHHLPWRLEDAEAEFKKNTMAAAARISLPGTVPLLHFSKRLEVLIWPLRRADEADHRV
jgi:uncharacterized protein